MDKAAVQLDIARNLGAGESDKDGGGLAKAEGAQDLVLGVVEE